jgi:hypothetical protein
VVTVRFIGTFLAVPEGTDLRLAGSGAHRRSSLRSITNAGRGIDPDKVSFTVTVRIARDHAPGVSPADPSQARRNAIQDILDDLLLERRDRQCERVKKPPDTPS